jgi:Protein of unknown function (DUF1153)
MQAGPSGAGAAHLNGGECVMHSFKLPPNDTIRWSPARKAAVVDGVRSAD